jgi:thiamine biosynthesis lipoprotein
MTTARASFRSIGTTAAVTVTDPAVLDDARALLAGQLDELDLAASRFREDSELSRINRANGGTHEVGALLAEAIAVALRAARDTDGAVDPTVGGAMVALGWDRDFAEVRHAPGPVRLRAARVPGWRRVALDADRRLLHLPHGVQLDLGATAKAFAADRAAAAIHDELGCGVLVGLGGDIACAGEPPAGGWRVRLATAHDAPASEAGPIVVLRRGGIATSSTRVRRWHASSSAGGAERSRELHHVLDPATGLPAEEVVLDASVAAPTCAAANAASTAAIVRGASAPTWLADRGIPARLRMRAGEVVTTGGWPGEEAAA